MQLTGTDGPVRLTELENGLLGLAALHGRVGVDSLGEWLWDGDPPSSARNRVQSLVSGIRRKAGAGPPVIVTEGRGYRLGDDVEVDLATWTDEVAAARLDRPCRPDLALGHYDAALAVFTHEPLQGAPQSAAVEVERSRLTQERLSVLEERHDAALRAGSLDGLVAELDALTARHPYHEGFTALFMLALAASGQQSRALEVFQDTRTRLDEELGVRPSDQLHEAQRLVLAGATLAQPLPEASGSPGTSGTSADGAPVEPADGSPAAPVLGLPVPRTLPRRPASFVGRDPELDDIAAAAGAVERDAVVVTLTGLPGCGKSAIALEAGHRLRDLFPDGALYHDAANTPGGASVDGVVTAFLPLLGVHPEAVPADPRSRAGLYRSLLDGRRMLVVIDNVEASSAPGAVGGSGLADLLPTSSGSMAIVTSRRPVSGIAVTRRVRVPSLPTEAARQLLATLVGPGRVADEPDAADAVLRLTGRVPFALRLVAGRLAQRPDLSLEDLVDRLEDAGAGTDEIAALRKSLDRIIADLEPAARRVVEAVAHLPVDTFSGWVAGAVLDDPRAGDQALDAMVETSLVETVVREGYDAQFRLHDLVRAHVRAESARGDDPASHPRTREETAAVARAAVARASVLLAALPQRFIPPAPRPADLDDVGVPARPRRAGRLYFRTDTPLLVALATAVTREHPELAWRLLADTALGTGAATDVHAWFEAERHVARSVEGADDDSRLGSAYLLLCRAWLLQDRRSASREAAELAEAARPRLVLLGAHGPAAAAALVCAQAATSLGMRSRAEAAIGRAEASLGQVADPVLAAWAAIARGTVHNDYDELRDAAREFTRAREILASTPRTVAYGLATLELSRARRRTGELGPATLLVDEALDTLSGVGAVHMYSYALDARAEVSLAAGRAAQALEEATTALERATASRDAFLGARARRTRGRALFALGRLEEAEEALRRAVEEFTALDRPLSVAFTYQVLAGVLDARADPVGAGEALRLEEAALRQATDARPTAHRRSPGPA
ncbi:AfsR/SARP family transcriptional regulator [uncultured Phycicoccus sp.]|uniref:AfsR/SARP family transcriptional regulator n=1 Tax=uncultured Phycicoccus sp. TaxID=661422 RepID=UPI00263411D2|nr:AfsR/SARP family transcriptional regulator [uncultured Phycicoccus sp.]